MAARLQKAIVIKAHKHRSVQRSISSPRAIADCSASWIWRVNCRL